ncbi:MAG: ATP synthase subunit I [Burkholderiales bacterium]
MKTIAPVPQDQADEPEFKPLTAEEARWLREKNPPVSPWRVIGAQIIMGVLVACAAFALTGRLSVFWSCAYGAAAVVLPTALFARGLMSRVSSANAGAAVAGFFLWEMVKIGLTVAMLFAAPRLVENLSWPAMLVGLVATMKVYWLVMLFKKHFQVRAKE